MKRSLVAGAVVLFAWHVPPVQAQDLSVRVGGLHARYADSLSGTAGSLAGRVVLDRPRVRLASTFSIAQFTSGNLAGQLGGSLLTLRPVRSSRLLSAGVLAQGSGSWLQGGTLSGTLSGGPVVALAAGPWLAWASGEAGGLRRIDGTNDGLVGATVHLRRDLGSAWGVDASASAAGAGPVRYQDYTLSIDGRVGVVSGGVVAGARAGGLGGGQWVQAQAAWRIADAWALEVEGGKYPADITGFNHGLFLTAGVRVGLTRNALDSRRGRTTSGDVRLERAGGGRVRLIFRVPRADSVALAGEWNDWTASKLAPRPDGRWEAVLRLEPGAYRFSLVVNGDRWLVPAGVSALDDDFGGRVGLLVIPR